MSENKQKKGGQYVLTDSPAGGSDPGKKKTATNRNLDGNCGQGSRITSFQESPLLTQGKGLRKGRGKKAAIVTVIYDRGGRKSYNLCRVGEKETEKRKNLMIAKILPADGIERSLQCARKVMTKKRGIKKKKITPNDFRRGGGGVGGGGGGGGGGGWGGGGGGGWGVGGGGEGRGGCV